MHKGQILIVEDDLDVADMLRVYFGMQGYEVWTTPEGLNALPLCVQRQPDVVILDINLPDIDGYEVCRRLRGDLRTAHIPIIFLTQRRERNDLIVGLSVGGDDYITKPFSVEELALRVRNAISRARYQRSTDPHTGLPSGPLIETQLKRLLRRDNWAILYLSIDGFDDFSDTYGFVTGRQVLSFVANLLREAVGELALPEAFIGHVGKDEFLVITSPEHVDNLRRLVVERFNKEVRRFYSSEAGPQGGDTAGERQPVKPMTLLTGVVTDKDGPFADIRGLTMAAVAARRRKR